MAGFLYNDHSTYDILDTNLILCSLTSVQSVQGLTRDLIEGDPTISRPIVNEYGTIAQHLEFEYALIKENLEPFTQEEQIVVERWLTSPKFSSPLITTDCDNEQKYKYYGKFTATEWFIPIDGGYGALNFKFSVNGSYGYEHHTFEMSTPNDAPRDNDGLPAWVMSVNCITDELEEWVYPKIEVTGNGVATNFRLQNFTDDGRFMQVRTNDYGKYTFDCKHCMIYGESGSVNFDELGWDDVGNIYWPRLKAGRNYITITGDMTVNIEYDSPVKIVGGWLT